MHRPPLYQLDPWESNGEKSFLKFRRLHGRSRVFFKILFERMNGILKDVKGHKILPNSAYGIN